jgi:Zn-dependent protease with chaperone function
MKKNQVLPSLRFRKEAAKAMLAIVLFVISYAVLLLLATALTLLCLYLGFNVMINNFRFLSIALGVGIMGFGLLIFYFLIKFIFSSHKMDRSHLVEITREQQPHLFAMIDEIVAEVGTQKPKQVYITPEVNASVFYDSSFWSMFLPVPKNLIIGVGLVNTVTKNELRSIIAHEFGHFSQRSMKVGSYVYQVNQVIFNLVYEDKKLDSFTSTIAEFHGILGIFVMLASFINRGIKWILKQLYVVVNKTYMGLSREMEFHADAIAASVTGYEPLKTSLLRSPIADATYNMALSLADRKVPVNQRVDNIYDVQYGIMFSLAARSNVPITNHFPNPLPTDEAWRSNSRLIIKDQWASHPSHEDRIERLTQTGFTADAIEDAPANELFEDFKGLQKRFTDFIYNGAKFTAKPELIAADVIVNEFNSAPQDEGYSPLFNGYYNDKATLIFDLDAAEQLQGSWTIEELFNTEKVELLTQKNHLDSYHLTLSQIASGQIKIGTFDFDGKKYRAKHAAKLVEQIDAELKVVDEKIIQNDMAIYRHFLTIEQSKGLPPQLRSLYSAFFAYHEEYGALVALNNKMNNHLGFVAVETPYETIEAKFRLHAEYEAELKKNLAILLEDPILQADMDEEFKKVITQYLSQEQVYFSNNQYNNEALDLLNQAMHGFAYLIQRKYQLMQMEIGKEGSKIV